MRWEDSNFNFNFILKICSLLASGQPLQQYRGAAGGVPALPALRVREHQGSPPPPSRGQHRPHPALRPDDRQDGEGHRGVDRQSPGWGEHGRAPGRRAAGAGAGERAGGGTAEADRQAGGTASSQSSGKTPSHPPLWLKSMFDMGHTGVKYKYIVSTIDFDFLPQEGRFEWFPSSHGVDKQWAYKEW